jgi:hypothetical protein
MDNPESYASLATRHRTTGKKKQQKNQQQKTQQQKTQHIKTKKVSNADPIKQNMNTTGVRECYTVPVSYTCLYR